MAVFQMNSLPCISLVEHGASGGIGLPLADLSNFHMLFGVFSPRANSSL